MNRFTRAGLAALAVTLVATVPGFAQAQPTPTPTPATASTPAAKHTVSVTTPTGDYDPVYLTITGLNYGEGVRIKGAPQGWRAEYWYDRAVIQNGEGPLKVWIEAPLGWPDNHPFVWEVTFEGGTVLQTSFVYSAAASPSPTAGSPTAKTTTGPTATSTPPPKDRGGGLAKTGV